MKDILNFLKLIKLLLIIVLVSNTNVLGNIDISINEGRPNKVLICQALKKVPGKYYKFICSYFAKNVSR